MTWTSLNKIGFQVSTLIPSVNLPYTLLYIALNGSPQVNELNIEKWDWKITSSSIWCLLHKEMTSLVC